MSWLRNSPLRESLGKRPTHSLTKECDPSACYESFRKHWQQIYDIVKKAELPKYYLNKDDVLSVVSLIRQMETILLLELKSFGSKPVPSCLEFLLTENILDKLYNWSLRTGKYMDIMKEEQIKLYEMLISNSRHELIGREPVARPLLKLLDNCDDFYPPELEKRLVILLNQLCVSVMQNIELLALFFTPSSEQSPAKFILFSLLVRFIHQEGAIGQQARDALLLCMSVSQKKEDVGLYIAENSNICELLVSGLCALYSRLPRKLVIEVDDWHRLTTDDVNELDELNMFMNSLEFCNAIALSAHPRVKAQLLKFLYECFLIQVMKPALLQDTVGLSVESLDSAMEVNNVEELIAATAYFDLFLRSITEPCMLYYFVKFLIVDEFEGERILNILIQRLGTKTRLCLVSLALFETLVDLNCEDVMLELVFRYLIPCSHVMLSQRKRVNDMSTYNLSALKFLSLSPSCCSVLRTSSFASKAAQQSVFSSIPSMGSHQQIAPNDPSNPPAHPNSTHSLPPQFPNEHSHRRTVSGSELHFTSSGKTDSLFGNYIMYVLDAKRTVGDCAKACHCWSYPYNGENPPYNALSQPKRLESRNGMHQNCQVGDRSSNAGKSDGSGKCLDPLQCASVVDLHESVSKLRISDRKYNKSGSAVDVGCGGKSLVNSDVSDASEQWMAKDGSQLSVGESSGYESFPFKESRENSPENECEHGHVKVDRDARHGVNISEMNSIKSSSDSAMSSSFGDVVKASSSSSQQHSSKDGLYLDIYNTTPNIGPFMEILLKKLEGMMFNNLYINLHLTGLISRLAVYPQPLLHSFLLNHTLVFQPSIRSLFQVLESLKHKIDSYLSKHENVSELMVQAQQFLICREERLINVRKHMAEGTSMTNRRTSVPEPFSRNDVKRESLTSRLSSVFKRATASSNNSHDSRLQTNPDGSGYRYFHRLSWGSSESKDDRKELWSVVMCSVILDEWLKELAAITQEHFVLSDYPFRDITS